MNTNTSSTWQRFKKLLLTFVFIVTAFFLVLGADGVGAQSAEPAEPGSIGITGRISAPPPTLGAFISIPTNGQNFDELPLTVSGLCPTGLLVKIFKNNVFAGSVVCVDGSFSLQTDLFVGTNDLIARVYDDLDQSGPDSNTVTTTYSVLNTFTSSRVSLTSNFAKRGANPGQNLVWPVILSGGQGPYAFSVNWGDGKEPDLFTVPFADVIDLEHVYDTPGIYNITVKVVDTNGSAAFLQLVGVANGPLSQTTDDGSRYDAGVLASSAARFVWWPAALIVPTAFLTFWLGKRYMLSNMKTRIKRGEHPFAD